MARQDKQKISEKEDNDVDFSKEVGICTHSSNAELILDGKHIIPRARLIRAEIMEGGE